MTGIYEMLREKRKRATDSIGTYQIGSPERRAAGKTFDFVTKLLANACDVFNSDIRSLVEENRRYTDPVGEMLQYALRNLEDKRRPIRYLLKEPLKSQLDDIKRQVYGALREIENRTMTEAEYNSLLNLKSDFAKSVKAVESVWSPVPPNLFPVRNYWKPEGSNPVEERPTIIFPDAAEYKAEMNKLAEKFLQLEESL